MRTDIFNWMKTIISVNEVMDKLGLTTPDELDSFQDAVDYFSSLASVMNTV